MVVFGGTVSVPLASVMVFSAVELELLKVPLSKVISPTLLVAAAASASRSEQLMEGGELPAGQFAGVPVASSSAVVTT